MTTTAPNHPFSICYYDDATGPKLARTEFASIAAAVAYAASLGIPLTHLSLTEWDINQLNACGVPEILASCNLDEAAEGNYTSLSY